MFTLGDFELLLMFVIGFTAAFAARWAWAQIAAHDAAHNPYFPRRDE
jgi:hypothetical protein